MPVRIIEPNGALPPAVLQHGMNIPHIRHAGKPRRKRIKRVLLD